MNTNSPTARLTQFLLVATLSATPVLAGDWASYLLGGDSDSGINGSLIYTSTADFGGGTTINGVSFSDSGTSGTNYSLGGVFASPFTGYANGLAGALNGAASSFLYNGNGTGDNSMTLTGLTIGQQYVTSWYNASFGGRRYIDITPSDTGLAFRFNEDANVGGAGNVLRYAFTATATSQTYNFDAVSNGDSFHHYAFSNAERNDGVFSYTHFAPVTPIVTNVSGQDSPFTPSNTDLLQTSVASMVSIGNFNREPILGGLGVLTDGTMSLGIGGNRPGMVTGENNSSITYTLDTSANTFGYDVSSITGFGGWGDGGRDEQRYSIFVSQIGSPDFILYGQLQENPASPGSPSGVMAQFNGSISNIDEVKFVFLDQVENGFVGYGEFDVVGTASVPEPTSVTLGLLGGLAFLSRRRRK